jgi:MHS family proline/betaine transporter-like MFS transporter
VKRDFMHNCTCILSFPCNLFTPLLIHFNAVFMEVLAEPPKEHSFWVNAGSLLFGLILPLPFAGMLSDYVGRFKVMVSGAIGLSIIGPIGMMVIAKGSEFDAFLAQCAIGVFLGLFGAPMNAWLVDMFPQKIRLTSAALGYDLASCTAAAFSPLVATLLTKSYGPNSVGGIYTVFAFCAFGGMYLSTMIPRDGDSGEVQQFESPRLELADTKPKTNEVV